MVDGIITDTVKKQLEGKQLINRRFHWLKRQQQQQQFKIYQAPGRVNLFDYFTKHHSGMHHKTVQLVYLYKNNNELDMLGCIIILGTRCVPKAFKSKLYQTVINSKNTVVSKISNSHHVFTNKRQPHNNNIAPALIKRLVELLRQTFRLIIDDVHKITYDNLKIIK